LAAIEYEENLRRDVKKRRRIPFFFFFWGDLQIDRLLRGETVVFAVELDEVESTRAAAANGDDRKKEKQTDRSWRAETDGSKRSETRETTKRNLFGGRTLQRGGGRKGRSWDVGCHQASPYKCIPSFTEPTLSFTGLYPPVFALLQFETDDSNGKPT